MKHNVIITKQDFIKGDYINGYLCPLALALKRTFPEASNVAVGVAWFQFTDPKLGVVERDFIACELMEDHAGKNPAQMENLILKYAKSSNPEPLTFNFMTHH